MGDCARYSGPAGPDGVKNNPVDRWEGEKCTTCKWSADDCMHPSASTALHVSTKANEKTVTATETATSADFNSVNCTCQNCMRPWGGALCEICQIKPMDCKHNSRLNTVACKCESC